MSWALKNSGSPCLLLSTKEYHWSVYVLTILPLWTRRCRWLNAFELFERFSCTVQLVQEIILPVFHRLWWRHCRRHRRAHNWLLLTAAKYIFIFSETRHYARLTRPRFFITYPTFQARTIPLFWGVSLSLTHRNGKKESFVICKIVSSLLIATYNISTCRVHVFFFQPLGLSWICADTIHFFACFARPMWMSINHFSPSVVKNSL